MKSKLIIFDPAEMAREEISKICLNLNKPIIISKDLKDLETALYKGHKPLVTEFNLACLEKEEINLFLNSLITYQTPAIIYTNTQMYKEYLDKLKEANIYSIIRKSRLNRDSILRSHIEFLLSGKNYEEMKIIDTEKTENPRRIAPEQLVSNGYRPNYLGNKARIRPKSI